MTETDGNRSKEILVSFLDRANAWFRYHAFGYIGGNVILTVINILTADHWWAFWPFFFWTILFAFHFFLIKSLRANDDWAESRALRLRSKSYDIDHIRSIERSYATGTMPGQHDLNLQQAENTETETKRDAAPC